MPERRARTTVFDNGIIAVDTEYERPVQDASHLIIESGRAAFVDTGVNSSVPLLLDALAQQDLDLGDVDYLFLTHVHLDHAGGAGSLMQALPNARCVIHPRGARHMIDPTRLIAGTELVYGKEKMREVYGTIVPIDADRVIEPKDGEWFELNGRSLQTIYTEGHARHHYVLNDPQARGVFTGDSFGVSYRELDTERGEIVFPTSTPVHFDPDEAHKAVDLIMSLEPEQLYLTHYSQVRNLERLAAEMHDGLDAFVAIAERHRGAENRKAALQESLFEYSAERLAEHGYSGDVETIHAVLDMDIDLNAQGLEVWLDRTA